MRTTMTSLVGTLRGMCNSGTADYTLGTVAYWSDDQLQTALDRYAKQVRDEPLDSYPVNISGTANWYDYQSKSRWFETTNGGTATFIIRNSLGSAIASGYTPNYETGLITFSTDQSGTAYYLTATSYDVYAAAADVWYQKAAHASEAIDFSTMNHSIKRSHVAALAMKMAQRYEALASTPMQGETPLAIRGDLCH